MPQVGMQLNPGSLIQCGPCALGGIPGLLALTGVHWEEKRTRRTTCVFGEL